MLPVSDTAAELFDNHLFETDPTTNALFKGDMKVQGRMFMKMITATVNDLNDIDALIPAVQELGRRHGDYDVQEVHYGSVGSALLWTLEQSLGDSFTPKVKTAWAETYMLLAGVMQDAAAKTAKAA